MKNIQGTTLVEVIVATTLLVSVVGLITLSLAAVFEGYTLISGRSTLDQDGQYIVARIRYASAHQDSRIVVSQFGNQDFTAQNAVLSQITTVSADPGGLTLDTAHSTGDYTSPIFKPDATKGVTTFAANTTRPAGASLSYTIAVSDPVDGSCTNSNYVYVGPDGTTNTQFTTDYFSIPTNNDGVGYENPASCLRYKVHFSKTTTAPVLYGVTITN